MIGNIKRDLETAYSLHKDGKLDDAEPMYHRLLNYQFDDPTILYLLGDLYARKKAYGISANLLYNSVQIKADMQPAWVALGIALKGMNQEDLALKAWEKAVSLGETPEILINMAGLYADSGEPRKALEILSRAEKLETDNPHIQWNQAMALMAQRNWAECWGKAEARMLLPSWNERTKINVPKWDGEPGRVLVHGEQGVGDEIMFASCINDLLKTNEVVIECTPRLVPIFERSFGVRCYPSQDDVDAKGIDYKIGFASLPKHFRKKSGDFPGSPYILPDEEQTKKFRRKLEELGPGPYVGIAWLGGINGVRPADRSVGLEFLAPILAGRTMVSVQYGVFSKDDAEKYGVHILDQSYGQDMAAHLALINALDYIVSVPQTAVHEAGSIGKKCFCLTPKRSTWPFGTCESNMPWYSSVELIRQDIHGEWGPVIKQTALRMNEQDKFCHVG